MKLNNLFEEGWEELGIEDPFKSNQEYLQKIEGLIYDAIIGNPRGTYTKKTQELKLKNSKAKFLDLQKCTPDDTSFYYYKDYINVSVKNLKTYHDIIPSLGKYAYLRLEISCKPTDTKINCQMESNLYAKSQTGGVKSLDTKKEETTLDERETYIAIRHFTEMAKLTANQMLSGELKGKPKDQLLQQGDIIGLQQGDIIGNDEPEDQADWWKT